MPIIMPRRKFLTGLFAAPAIVAVNSIMPISPTSIFKLEKFTEIPTFDRWCLVNENGGSYAWMMESYVNQFINPLEVIKKVNMDQAFGIKESSKQTAELMKNFNAPVIHEVPWHFLKGTSIDVG